MTNETNAAAIRPSQVQVITTPYEFAHGRAPKGRGAWAFEGCDLGELYWFNGLYSDARREAKKHFAALGVTHISVAS